MIQVSWGRTPISPYSTNPANEDRSGFCTRGSNVGVGGGGGRQGDVQRSSLQVGVTPLRLCQQIYATATRRVFHPSTSTTFSPIAILIAIQPGGSVQRPTDKQV